MTGDRGRPGDADDRGCGPPQPLHPSAGGRRRQPLDNSLPLILFGVAPRPAAARERQRAQGGAGAGGVRAEDDLPRVHPFTDSWHPTNSEPRGEEYTAEAAEQDC